jgi:hypothetical protein
MFCGGKDGDVMSKGPVRFTSQWILVGVILFYTLGTTMIARHTKRIFKPASAGGSEYGDYSGISEGLNHPSDGVYAQNSTNRLVQWGGRESNLMLYDVTFGPDQFYEDGSAAEQAGRRKTEELGNAEKKNSVQQELTKIRTNIKCVETILRNAVIEPYCTNGQIEGLQINGLDEISEAKALLLKSGDVILAVNGQTLNSKKDAYEIFIKARKEPIMVIDLLQDGQAKKLLLDFQ